MNPARRLATIPIIGAALGLLAFGIVRGASSPGPARGTRMSIAIEPPLDAAARAIAEHVVRERIEEKGQDVRIVGANDGLVVEVPEQDPEIVGHLVQLVERKATLELRRVGSGGALADEVSLAGGAITRAAIIDHGVDIEHARGAAKQIDVGAPLAFVLDGQVKRIAAPDHVSDGMIHVPITGATIDEAVDAGHALVLAIEAGAAHPLRVVRREPFTRATGFLPRAWPFLAIAVALLLVAAFVWRSAGTRET